MKTIIGLLFFISLAAQAVPTSRPLIVKSSGGGHAPAEWVRYERCEVYLDRVVITKDFGMEDRGFNVKEERKIEVSPSIKETIRKAVKEEIEEKENGMCDAPSTYIGFTVGNPEHLLFTSGGCGSPRKIRNGPYSHQLMGLVDTYCPKTFDRER